MASGDLTRVRTNIAALNALQALRNINADLNIHTLRLSTGKRINSAGDDPAGLILGNLLTNRSRQVGAALQNVGDAQNLMSISEGGLNNINELLSTMAEKVTLAASDTQGVAQRSAIQNELNQLGLEIDTITQQTQFNGVILLTALTMTFQTGPDSLNYQVFAIASALHSAALLINTLTVATQALASQSLLTVNNAITTIQNNLQLVGSTLERFNVRVSNLGVSQVNLQAAASRILDADLAAEQLMTSRDQILQSTATTQLAAANAATGSILSLFK